jgi:hypothetical protein
LGLKLGIEDCEQWLEDCPDRVYRNWYAAYQCEPFGNETELLARIASLLYIIASKGTELEVVSRASDAILRTLMPSDWVSAKDTGHSVASVDVDDLRKQFREMDRALAGAFG